MPRDLGSSSDGSDQSLPLSAVSAGECVRVTALRGGRAFQRAMIGMGLRRGCEIRVLQGGGGQGGPLFVAIGESRVALGSGMAEKILVAHAAPVATEGLGPP